MDFIVMQLCKSADWHLATTSQRAAQGAFGNNASGCVWMIQWCQ
jgi:hypothetical protein